METALTTTESRQIILSERCEKLLELYNPKQLHHTFAAVKSVADSLAIQDQGEPCLLAIEHRGESERKKLLATIKLNIIALDRFLHLKNPLSEEETDFIAEQIVEEFGGSLTFADLHLVMKRGKCGAYGKLYERLSAPTVLEWFREYYNSRLDAAYEYNLNKDKKRFSGANDGDKVLVSLGYEFVDGKVSYRIEKPSQSDQMRKGQSADNTDEEYQRYKAELIRNNFKLSKQ